MFSFELLVGSAGWARMFEKITDMASQGLEVNYSEAPGKITIPNPNGQPFVLEGIIAKGFVRD